MSNSPAVQKARKDMQLARLKKKGSKDYPAFYAAQPLQVELARKNNEYRAAQQALRNANEAFEIARITGEGLDAARETQAIASLVAERSKPTSGAAAANLSGA